MIEPIQKKHLVKGELVMTISLYKESHGCYRYSIDQTYKKEDGTYGDRNSDFSAGALKANAITTFDKAIERMLKKGYTYAEKKSK